MEVPTIRARGVLVPEVIRIGNDLSNSAFAPYRVDQQEHCQLKRSLERTDAKTVWALKLR